MVSVFENYGLQWHPIAHDAPGESDDDREERTAAANFACNARSMFLTSILFYFALYKYIYLLIVYTLYTYFSLCLSAVFADFACSSPFWKKMEPIFGFSLQEAFYMKEQVETTI